MNLNRPLAQSLLSVMDRKHHWAYPALTQPGLSRAALLAHFKSEYLVYVRDFPVLLARVLGVTPPLADVRAALAENIYEEQTGMLSKSAPHPELFLRMMEGLGFARADFEDDEAWLTPEARAYKAFLFEHSAKVPWQASASLMTIWVEGSKNERAELSGTFLRKKGDDAIRSHALVVHYGCPEAAMQLVRAHGDVEGAHRADAWNAILSNVGDDGPVFDAVSTVVTQAHSLWLAYRESIAVRMGLSKPNSLRTE
jgi:pyrroloquinoline quinone (PQQ) biosynthesis protein C